MKKIPNLFERDWNGDRSRVLPELHKGADVGWVLCGEGVPTVKWDGSAVMIRAGKLFVRFDCKRGKTAPPDFEPCDDEDSKTGHRPGWIPAVEPYARWHLDAWKNSGGDNLPNSTYEACGPQHQTNPYGFPKNILIAHGANEVALALWPVKVEDAFDYLKEFLGIALYQPTLMPAPLKMEGLVWHHPDGRMAKVLASDLGLPWKAKSRKES